MTVFPAWQCAGPSAQVLGVKAGGESAARGSARSEEHCPTWLMFHCGCGPLIVGARSSGIAQVSDSLFNGVMGFWGVEI